MALPTRAKPYSPKGGEFHFHGCETCGLKFGDACQTPDVNPTCPSCRSGFTRALWDRNRDPVDCCLDNSRQVTPAERKPYALAGGAHVWYICRTCSRTHPFNPTRRPE
jgi:hypothetical protein